MQIGVQDSDITVETVPENPAPYQDVQINLSSFATDLNSSMIEWYSGNKVILAGYGKTSYSFKAQGPNTSTSIQVVITPSGSTTHITKSIAINPTEIDILWEGLDAYTPPFYRGKSFPSSEGLIRAVAIPNSNTIKSGKGNIVYNWRNGDSAAQSASGFNKDSYIFANNELNKKESISVTASSVDGKYRATEDADIPIVSPEMYFYEKSPTEGILYNKALSDDTFVSADEYSVVAAPYFLSLKGNESKYTYAWKINDADIDTPSKKIELTIRPSSRGGYATIDLSMENLSSLFQKVSKRLKLNL